MRTKILVFVMIFSLCVSLITSIVMFFAFSSIGVRPEEVSAMNEYTGSNTAHEEPVTQNNDQQDTETDLENLADERDTESELKIIAVGDILLGRGVKTRVENQPQRYIYPFENVVDILRSGDVVFGNLEEPITASTKGLTGINQGGKYVLKNDPEAMNGLEYAGFNLFSLANNHILDYYHEGLFDTMKVLDQKGIAYAGAGKNLEEARKMTIIEKNGLKIGMLAYTDMADILYKGDPPLRFTAKADSPGVAPTKREYILEDVSKARDSVDILIVSLHWGIEYSYEPTTKQIDFAHELIDNGVDILMGHHTHRCQGVEIYKGKPIFYSLGNFLFDQNNPLNQEGFIFDIKLNGTELIGLEGIPFKILDKSRIEPQKGAGAGEMLQREMDLCSNLNTPSRIENDRLIFEIQ